MCSPRRVGRYTFTHRELLRIGSSDGLRFGRMSKQRRGKHVPPALDPNVEPVSGLLLEAGRENLFWPGFVFGMVAFLAVMVVGAGVMHFVSSVC